MNKLYYGLFLMFVFPATTMAAKITLCYENKELLPYYVGNTYEIPENRPGQSIEQIRNLKNHVPGLTVSFERAPWDRCKLMLKENQVQAIIASYQLEREELGVYPKTTDNKPDITRALSYSRDYMYSLRKKKYDYKDKKFINFPEKATIGLMQGYSVGKMLRELGFNLSEEKALDSIFKRLALGRIDSIAMTETAADDFILRRADYGLIVVKSTSPLSDKAYYVLLSHQFVKDHPKESQAIWAAMPALRIEGVEIGKAYLN